MRFAFFFATIFGIVSPKMMTSTVVMTVESQVQLSPAMSMTTTEAMDEVAMFTRLLPMSIAESESSNLSMTLSAILARPVSSLGGGLQTHAVGRGEAHLRRREEGRETDEDYVSGYIRAHFASPPFSGSGSTRQTSLTMRFWCISETVTCKPSYSKLSRSRGMRSNCS